MRVVLEVIVDPVEAGVGWDTASLKRNFLLDCQGIWYVGPDLGAIRLGHSLQQHAYHSDRFGYYEEVGKGRVLSPGGCRPQV